MTDGERIDAVAKIAAALYRRADTLAGNGTSVAADEVRHLARLLEEVTRR
jgi:hypothetical protein